MSFDENWVIAALYEFVAVKEDLSLLKKELLTFAKEHGIVGTLILAEEGINGTIAGSREAIDLMKDKLRDKGFQKLEYKESFLSRNQIVFYKMKIKIKKEIVTMRIDGIEPNQYRGIYLEPREFHQLIQQEDVILLDTRNDYEYRVGSFKGAINPNIRIFVQFPEYLEAHRKDWADKRIAMFCTGGIRCEKSTAYAKQMNFGKEVYHLKGGILNYFKEIPESESLWEGDCFVFDYRVSLNHQLQPGEWELCYACWQPLSQEDRQSAFYQKGVSCPYCVDQKSSDQIKSYKERQKQLELGSFKFFQG